MIMSWMLHTIVATFFVTIAAILVDRMMQLLGRPRRWIWIGALVASILLPLIAVVAPLGHPLLTFVAQRRGVAELLSRVSELLPSHGGSLSAALQPTIVSQTGNPTTAAGSLWLTWSMVTTLGWILGSVGLTGLLLRAHRWLQVQSASWYAMHVDAIPVLVTPSTGPAVMGVRRPVVLLPMWVLELPSTVRRIVVQHEREHLSAGDSRLLVLAAVIVILMPWNICLWWQCLWLRRAIETDCDARVLATGTDVRQYGEALLDIAGREARLGKGIPLFSAAFSVNGSLLERRLIAMTTRRIRPQYWRARVAAMAGVTLFVGSAAYDASSMTRLDMGAYLYVRSVKACECEAPKPERAPVTPHVVAVDTPHGTPNDARHKNSSVSATAKSVIPPNAQTARRKSKVVRVIAGYGFVLPATSSGTNAIALGHGENGADVGNGGTTFVKQGAYYVTVPKLLVASDNKNLISISVRDNVVKFSVDTTTKGPFTPSMPPLGSLN